MGNFVWGISKEGKPLFSPEKSLNSLAKMHKTNRKQYEKLTGDPNFSKIKILDYLPCLCKIPITNYFGHKSFSC